MDYFFFYFLEIPNKVPNTKLPVNEAEEFCCLFSTKLGHKSLLFGAEMDGVCNENQLVEPIDWYNVKFIELKTNKIVKTNHQQLNYKKKLLKWWCQSFLVGIDEVICGTRTENGIVFQLDDIKVSHMPKISKVK